MEKKSTDIKEIKNPYEKPKLKISQGIICILMLCCVGASFFLTVRIQDSMNRIDLYKKQEDYYNTYRTRMIQMQDEASNYVMDIIQKDFQIYLEYNESLINNTQADTAMITEYMELINVYDVVWGIVDIQNNTIWANPSWYTIYWLAENDSVLTQFPECSNYTNIFIAPDVFWYNNTWDLLTFMANYYGYPCIWNFNFNDTAMRDYANTNIIGPLASLGDQLYYAQTALTGLSLAIIILGLIMNYSDADRKFKIIVIASIIIILAMTGFNILSSYYIPIVDTAQINHEINFPSPPPPSSNSAVLTFLVNFTNNSFYMEITVGVIVIILLSGFLYYRRADVKKALTTKKVLGYKI